MAMVPEQGEVEGEVRRGRCHSKAVVGWAMADHFKTSLVASALDMARGRMRIEKNAIFHSDRGSNDGRVLLRRAEERMPEPVRLHESREGTPRGCQIHRGTLLPN
nr:hypothetical protein [Embleya hyalina]